MARTSKYQNQIAVRLTENEWRAGLYIRLSKEDGDKLESESISSQRALLQKFAEDSASLNVYDVYIDDGFSGTDFNRPAFQRMLADITGRKINCVIVKDLSRFGRNYVEAGKFLETVFPLFGVRFIAVNDNIDSFANPQSVNNILVPFKNIINDEYCRDISQKVRSALDIRRKQGKFIGSFAAYGYKKDKNDRNKLVVDEQAAEIVRVIYRKFLQGYSIIGITRWLNAANIPNPSEYKRSIGLNCNRSDSKLWCDTTVRRMLSNPVYIGHMVQKKYEVISHKIHVSKAVPGKNRIKVENTHDPIIDRSDFEKVQDLLVRDMRVSPVENRLSVFSGFVKCADCGRAMQKRTVVQPYKTYDYYVCSTYKKTHACTKHATRADMLEEVVLLFLNNYIRYAVDFNRLFEKISSERRADHQTKALEKELKRMETERERAGGLLLDLYPDFKSGILSMEQYTALKERYEGVLKKTEEEATRLKAEIEALKGGFAYENDFITTFKKYSGLKELTREAVTELIENIFIHEDGSVDIHFRFKNEFSAARDLIEQTCAETEMKTAFK